MSRRSRRPSSQESELQARLNWALNATERKTRVWRSNAGVMVVGRGPRRRVIRGAPAGSADLIGIVSPEGYHLEIEVKDRARQTEKQKRWQRLIESRGGIYVLCRRDRKAELGDDARRCVAEVDAAIERKRRRALDEVIELPPGVDDLEQALTEVLKHTGATPDAHAILGKHGVSLRCVVGRRRTSEIVSARREIMLLLHRAGFSYSAIGRFFSRDHATIMAGCRRAVQREAP